jgi:hypothetical protein
MFASGRQCAGLIFFWLKILGSTALFPRYAHTHTRLRLRSHTHARYAHGRVTRTRAWVRAAWNRAKMPEKRMVIGFEPVLPGIGLMLKCD